MFCFFCYEFVLSRKISHNPKCRSQYNSIIFRLNLNLITANILLIMTLKSECDGVIKQGVMILSPIKVNIVFVTAAFYVIFVHPFLYSKNKKK